MPRVPLSADTPLEVEDLWLAGLRAQGPAWSSSRMAELSDFCRQAAKEAIRRAHPSATPAERDEILMRELYGDPELAATVVERRRSLGFYD
ncbi:MAG: hypothetical protein SF066_16325 [Thermoanaerobaculia bacterium]|nr:hypothetical protein [Thermoanaerobaculia bacterium]